MDFFEKFDEASWHFTFGHDHDPDKNVLQVGLVGVFFIEMGNSLWDKRNGMRRVIERYCELYGDGLRWGIIDDSKSDTPYDYNGRQKAADYLKRAVADVDNSLNLKWMSGPGSAYADDYLITAHSRAEWYQNVHRTMSSLCFFLPVERLQKGGRATFEQFLTGICDAVQPLHGYAGLGVQASYEQENHQHTEFRVAQEFLGLDAGARFAFLLGTRSLMAGIKTINWFTFLDKKWLDQLGGLDALRAQLPDPRIVFLPNKYGVGIRAGEWPELGWVQRDPYPELYVKVNAALKPVRAPKIGGLAFGSIAGEARFTHETSNLWMRRFDAPGIWPPPWMQPGSDAPQDPPVLGLVPSALATQESAEDVAPERVPPVYVGKPCPRSGWWMARALSGHKAYINAGEPMPGPELSPAGNQVIWYWVGTAQGNSKPG